MSLYIFCLILVVILIVVYFYLNRRNNLNIRKSTIEKFREIKEQLAYNDYTKKPSNINEWSYQRFCNFFDEIEPKDPEFDNKIIKIYDMIVNEKETDLDKIAEISGCNYNELILKIMYLKNKRKIGDLYIDRGDHAIRNCTKEDRKLLDKYSKYIYDYHDQPYDIARKLPECTATNINSLAKKVLDDLIYLDEKYLINGLNIDKVDNKIIYYTIEKHKKEKDYISINCKTCGALIDVPRGGKARCGYCKNIVVDKN